MLEMNLTLQIVICIALGLLAGGWLLYRRQAKELAEKSEELKRQKFQNKQLIIIEEILSKLNHQNRERETGPPLHPEGYANGENHRNGHAFSKTESTEIERQNSQNIPPVHQTHLHQIPQEKMAISNPIRRTAGLATGSQPPPVVITTTTAVTSESTIPDLPPGAEKIDQTARSQNEKSEGRPVIQPIINTSGQPIIQKEKNPTEEVQDSETKQTNHKSENLTAIDTAPRENKGLLERLQSSSPPLTERLDKAVKKQSFNPFKSLASTPKNQQPEKQPQEQKRQDPLTQQPLPKIVQPEPEAAKTSFVPLDASPAAVSPQEGKTKPPAKPAPPVKRRGESIPAPLNLDQDSNLYTRINDYARWVAAHSDRFRLEYYENGQPAGHISLVFNQEELARLNGHWFDMFRPYDLDEIFDAFNNSENTLYCSYSAETIEQLRAPALQILAYVDSEDNKRYRTVIEECALKEFVHYLGDLKQLAAAR